jgi:hypothetical protein
VNVQETDSRWPTLNHTEQCTYESHYLKKLIRRQANAATEYYNIYTNLCLDLPRFSQNKSETKNLVAPLPAVTPEEIGERYKDLEESIRGFIKDLDEAEKEEEEDGGTSEAASPSSVDDE